jgi:hypothetical protein
MIFSVVGHFGQSRMKTQFYNTNSIGEFDDNVGGYNINTLEISIVKNTYGLTSLVNNLKNNKPANVTDGQIDQLISHF